MSARSQSKHAALAHIVTSAAYVGSRSTVVCRLGSRIPFLSVAEHVRLNWIGSRHTGLGPPHSGVAESPPWSSAHAGLAMQRSSSIGTHSRSAAHASLTSTKRSAGVFASHSSNARRTACRSCASTSSAGPSSGNGRNGSASATSGRSAA
jgi:hypothetical protein